MKAHMTIKSLEEKIRLAEEKIEALTVLKKQASMEKDVDAGIHYCYAISDLKDYRSKCQQAVELLCYIQGKKITEDGLEDA